MKKLTIGRNNACDVIIPDTSDLVSRKQAVLTITFWGKMVLYDTSNNGTYINDNKLETGKGRPVTRKDKVNFAQVVDLDWNMVKDPYKKVKSICIIIAACIVAAGIIIAILLSRPAKKDAAKTDVADHPKTEIEIKDTVQPTKDLEPKEQQSVKKTKKGRRGGNANNKKSEPINIKNIKSKDTKDKAPIIY